MAPITSIGSNDKMSPVASTTASGNASRSATQRCRRSSQAFSKVEFPRQDLVTPPTPERAAMQGPRGHGLTRLAA